MLVAARFMQGAGGAATSAVGLGMIVTMFPKPHEQAKAIGVYAFVASAGGSIGLLAGGVITQALDWHWIFFVNVPIGIATAVLARRLIAADRGVGWRAGRGYARRGADHRRADAGRVHDRQARRRTRAGARPGHWSSARSQLALLAAFVAREATARTPLMPLRIFRSRNVAGANTIQALTVAGMFSVFFLGALYMQKVLHYDALQIGLAFLPTTMVMGAMSLKLSEPLIMRFGARRTLVPGLVAIAVGLALFTRAPVHGSYASDMLPTMILMGAGIGSAFPALMKLAMSGATPSDAGLASGLVNTTVQVGGALGLAVVATLAATRTEQPARERALPGVGADGRLPIGVHGRARG